MLMRVMSINTALLLPCVHGSQNNIRDTAPILVMDGAFKLRNLLTHWCPNYMIDSFVGENRCLSGCTDAPRTCATQDLCKQMLLAPSSPPINLLGPTVLEYHRLSRFHQLLPNMPSHGEAVLAPPDLFIVPSAWIKLPILHVHVAVLACRSELANATSCPCYISRNDEQQLLAWKGF